MPEQEARAFAEAQRQEEQQEEQQPFVGPDVDMLDEEVNQDIAQGHLQPVDPPNEDFDIWLTPQQAEEMADLFRDVNVHEAPVNDLINVQQENREQQDGLDRMLDHAIQQRGRGEERQLEEAVNFFERVTVEDLERMEQSKKSVAVASRKKSVAPDTEGINNIKISNNWRVTIEPPRGKPQLFHDFNRKYKQQQPIDSPQTSNDDPEVVVLEQPPKPEIVIDLEAEIDELMDLKPDMNNLPHVKDEPYGEVNVGHLQPEVVLVESNITLPQPSGSSTHQIDPLEDDDDDTGGDRPLVIDEDIFESEEADPYSKSDSIQVSKCINCRKSKKRLSMSSTLLKSLYKGDNNVDKCMYCGIKIAVGGVTEVQKTSTVNLVHCSICFRPLHKSSLLRHMREKHGKQNYKRVSCDLCKKDFTPRYLLDHKRKVHGAEAAKKNTGKPRPIPLTYELCPFPSCDKYLHRCSIARHLKTRHNTQRRAFTCFTCSEIFFTNAELKNHYQYHFKKFEHVCLLCKQSFSDMDSCKYHLTYVHKMENSKHYCAVK